MLVASTFMTAFWVLLIWVPLILLWSFALVDIFRRDDLGGLSKALWVLVVFVIPFIGTLVYLGFRPHAVTREERAAVERANRAFAAESSPDSPAAELKVLSDLHDNGKLTDDEFAAEKARVLSRDAAAGPR